MKITCYGSRGSLPSPSRKYDEFYTDEFGGNTTSYYVEAGPFRIIIDYGSGVMPLGNRIMSKEQFGPEGIKPLNFISLLTHYHSDHIQGIGFHTPMYISPNSFNFHGPHPSNAEHTEDGMSVVQKALNDNQEAPFFPVPHRELPAGKSYSTHSSKFSESFWYVHVPEDKPFGGALDYWAEDPSTHVEDENKIKITTIPLNHPNDCLGYLIEYCGKSIAFCTDTEPLRYPNKNMAKLCNSPDILLMDGQYTEEQIAGMCQGFGHGTPRSCLEEAINIQAKKLVVMHHDPANDDKTLTFMEKELQTFARDECSDIFPGSDVLFSSVEFAREGRSWEV